MTTAQAITYTVEACNLSHTSENKIHDDQIARMLGFSGGLVPGVELYAYACHPVVRRWGRDWLAGELFSYIDLAQRVPAKDPLRKIR